MKKYYSSFILALLVVFSLSNVLAAPMSVVFTSTPSTLPANTNYALSFVVNDALNLTANVTARFYVNAVNVVNATWTNNLTNSSAFSTTFNEQYYGYGDVVYVNVTAKEASNATATATNWTSTKTVTESTTTILARDSFDFLPGMGSAIGNFMTNITPGLAGLILVLAIVGAVVGILVAIGYLIKKGMESGKGHLGFKK